MCKIQKFPVKQNIHHNFMQLFLVNNSCFAGNFLGFNYFRLLTCVLFENNVCMQA